MSPLHAGAARLDITPPIGTSLAGSLTGRASLGVLDPLHTRALVLDNGDTRVALVTLDVIALGRADVDPARRAISEACGLPPENVLIAATHTHYAPGTVDLFETPREPAYVPWAMERTVDAVRLACSRLQPARLGWAAASCPWEVHNRRYRMRDGTVRMNPGYGNPDIVEVTGPTDPEVALLAVETAAGRPLGLAASYALHYVGGPYNDLISADYFGHFERSLHRMLGGADTPVLMFNACSGQINNIDPFGPRPEFPDPAYQARRVADVVAGVAFAGWRSIREWDTAPRLASALREVPFRRRLLTDEERAASRAVVAAGHDPAQMPLIDFLYAKERLLVDALPVERPTVMQAMALGGLGLATFSGEIFVELGLDLKARSPFPVTMIAELANDYIGYVPTPRAFEEGGYETWTARSACCAPDLGPELVDVATSLLAKVAA